MRLTSFYNILLSCNWHWWASATTPCRSHVRQLISFSHRYALGQPCLCSRRSSAREGGRSRRWRGQRWRRGRTGMCWQASRCVPACHVDASSSGYYRPPNLAALLGHVHTLPCSSHVLVPSSSFPSPGLSPPCPSSSRCALRMRRVTRAGRRDAARFRAASPRRCPRRAHPGPPASPAIRSRILT